MDPLCKGPTVQWPRCAMDPLCDGPAVQWSRCVMYPMGGRIPAIGEPVNRCAFMNHIKWAPAVRRSGGGRGLRGALCLITVLGTVLGCAWAGAGLALAAGPPDGRPQGLTEGRAVRFESCAGWGACTFRLVTPNPSLGDLVRVRLRGVGAPARTGTCSPELEGARTIRLFVEGILTRATRLELTRIEPRPDGSVLATVRADGTDVVDILVHIGLGRQKPLPPDADWCE